MNLRLSQYECGPLEPGIVLSHTLTQIFKGSNVSKYKLYTELPQRQEKWKEARDTQIPEITQEVTGILGPIKITDCWVANKTTNCVRRQTRALEKILANDMFDWELISRIYNETSVTHLGKCLKFLKRLKVSKCPGTY